MSEEIAPAQEREGKLLEGHRRGVHPGKTARPGRTRRNGLPGAA